MVCSQCGEPSNKRLRAKGGYVSASVITEREAFDMGFRWEKHLYGHDFKKDIEFDIDSDGFIIEVKFDFFVRVI